MDYSEFTKFEIARLIGARALQLAMGAPPMIELPNNVFEPSAIARLEFEKGVIPLTVYKAGD
ncbi:MAG: DNA-directed RNA polymerase subunit K [Candidatus Micrarchaeota archaeon]|nr:DNA-directed RNA polymerase subunit K [Candidatus Micrarchaeota archaeon]